MVRWEMSQIEANNGLCGFLLNFLPITIAEIIGPVNHYGALQRQTPEEISVMVQSKIMTPPPRNMSSLLESVCHAF